MAQAFGSRRQSRVAIEVGTHSPWVSRLLKSFGHEVIVANARQVQLISKNSRKSDKLDAERAGTAGAGGSGVVAAHSSPRRAGPSAPGRDSSTSGADRGSDRIGERGAWLGQVGGRTVGELRPGSDGSGTFGGAGSFPARHTEPLLQEIESLTARIKGCDHKIEQIAREYPECELLQQVSGVGTLIALTFVLTVEDPHRFAKSREVGCYVGLRPKRSDSGESQPQLRITKEGDIYLRKMLVQGAHYILGYRGPDTDLRRWGLKLAARGGKNAKKRAIVAVARKLGILLHRLWVTGEVYEPLRNSQAKQKAAKAAA